MKPIPRFLASLLPLLLPLLGNAAPTALEKKYGGEDFSFKVMREALEAASVRTLADILLIENRLPGGANQQAILKAMEKRKKCDSTRLTKTPEADFDCRSDPRSMRMLARQYARQEWLTRDLLLAGAQVVLCTSANVVKRPELPREQERVFKAYESTASVLFEDKTAVGHLCNVDELNRRMNGGESAGFLGKEAKRQALFSATEKIHGLCGGSLGDSNQQRALERALRYCSDRGANTDDEALEELDKLEAEVNHAASELMLSFLDFKRRLIPVSYQVAFRNGCPHGGWGDVQWDKGAPWRVEFSCFFGPTETWHFDPLADGGPQFSNSQILRDNRFMGDYSVLERASRVWMGSYLSQVNALRQEAKDHCKRDSEGMKNTGIFYLDSGLSFELICAGDGKRLWRRAFQVSVKQDAPVISN